MKKYKSKINLSNILGLSPLEVRKRDQESEEKPQDENSLFNNS